MAAADITANAKIATIEVDDTEHTITVESAGGSLVNVGSNPVFISMNSKQDGALARDGLQHDGEIQLDPNDSIPLPAETSSLREQCAATKTSKLWWIPKAG
jgi:hypothetical protein